MGNGAVLVGILVGVVAGVAGGALVGLIVARRSALLVASSVATAERGVRSDADASARHELQLRQAGFDQRVDDLRGELHRMSDLVVDLQRQRAEQQGRVERRLAEVLEVSGELASTTQSLREALASPNARGQWGERMADDVLRAVGLVEGVSYRKQAATTAGTVPDFTFMLPGGREMNMDVKFPVDNYLRYLEAENDHEAASFRTQFLRDVRSRVKELAGRSYIDAHDTVDEVLLFIPNEAVYAFVHTHDRDLLDLALRQKVVLCSPCTLYSVLAIVRQAVEQTQLQRTSDEILRCLADFETQWERFGSAFDRVGKQLDTLQRSWDDLSGTRRRQLDRQIDRIDDLRSRHAPGLRAIAGGDSEAS
jgi:DNA recombination protein RmuC